MYLVALCIKIVYNEFMDTVIVIPARLQSTRLPGKPLLKRNGVTLIETVWRQCVQTGFDVVVATDHEDIANTVNSFRGDVVGRWTTHAGAAWAGPYVRVFRGCLRPVCLPCVGWDFGDDYLYSAAVDSACNLDRVRSRVASHVGPVLYGI